MKIGLDIKYKTVKSYYYDFVESLNTDCLELQDINRILLNMSIRDYMVNGGKRDISKYCKYYV